MAKVYTIEQLEQLHKFAVEHDLYDNIFKPASIFFDMLKFRELPLLPPRDEKGQFIHRVSNEDIYELIKKKVSKG